MNELFQELYECRSFHYIEILLERALPTATGSDKETLETMVQAKYLDDVHALAADKLGLHEKAAEIRAFRAKKAGASKVIPDYLLCH